MYLSPNLLPHLRFLLSLERRVIGLIPPLSVTFSSSSAFPLSSPLFSLIFRIKIRFFGARRIKKSAGTLVHVPTFGVRIVVTVVLREHQYI